MDNVKEFKEHAINTYIADTLAEGWIDVVKTRKELKHMLGEEPAVELKYIQETKIDEGSNEETKVERLDSVIVYYTYENGNNEDGSIKYAYSKLEYII